MTFWFAWALVADLRAAVLTAVATGFATLLWPYSKFGFNAPLATLCVVSGVYLSWLGVRRERWGLLVGGGVALGCALLVRHELADRSRVPPRPRPAEGLARDFSEQFAFSLDFWWMYLFYLGVVPTAAALLLGGLPLAASALCLVKLRGFLGG